MKLIYYFICKTKELLFTRCLHDFIGLFHGLRVSELLSLQLSDLELTTKKYIFNG